MIKRDVLILEAEELAKNQGATYMSASWYLPAEGRPSVSSVSFFKDNQIDDDENLEEVALWISGIKTFQTISRKFNKSLIGDGSKSGFGPLAKI